MCPFTNSTQCICTVLGGCGCVLQNQPSYWYLPTADMENPQVKGGSIRSAMANTIKHNHKWSTYGWPVVWKARPCRWTNLPFTKQYCYPWQWPLLYTKGHLSLELQYELAALLHTLPRASSDPVVWHHGLRADLLRFDIMVLKAGPIMSQLQTVDQSSHDQFLRSPLRPTDFFVFMRPCHYQVILVSEFVSKSSMFVTFKCLRFLKNIII